MPTIRERIIELLVSQKVISKEKLEKAIEIQKKKSLPLKDVLLSEGLIEESRLMSAFSESLFIPTLNLSKYRIDKTLISRIPEKIARQYNLVPISVMGGTLTIAIADPLNIFAFEDLKLLTGYKIDVVLASQKDILKAIDNVYKEQSLPAEELKEEKPVESLFSEITQGILELGNLRDPASAVPVVKMVDLIVMDAFKKRASDIHLEPEEEDLRVRFRIDGDLTDAFSIPKKVQNMIIARLKIISGLDTTETRMPQDGRFKVKYQDKEIDFRVSALPTTGGQKMVLRILDKSALSLGLVRLGFSETAYKLLNEAIVKPFGMILVTGPTGSGKSTTLYSVLNQLNTPDRNIITIEDPVEYQLEGITQIQANADIGLTFANGLRSLLRQSPDIILVGEIRDAETADIAIKASLTGQLVMSTLHTNSAAGAVTRLVDMGVEPFLVASSLIMSSAQRLIRLNCEHCKEKYNPPEPLLKNSRLAANVEFFRGKGCNFCNNTGFYGRSAILEVLMVDHKIREMITQRISADKIENYAVKESGMRTLRQEAQDKALAGLTTLEEALRITTEE